MTPSRWEVITELFDAVLERSPEDRAAFLAEASLGDTAIHDEVQRLLAEHERAGDFLQNPPGAAPALQRLAVAPQRYHPDEIIAGRFQSSTLSAKAGWVWFTRPRTLAFSGLWH